VSGRNEQSALFLSDAISARRHVLFPVPRLASQFARQFDCFRKTAVTKQQKKVNEDDDEIDRRDRDVGSRLSLRLTLSYRYRM
jgi:hypothetical protein